MSGKVCVCGKVLSNVVYPNDLEWNIYEKSEFDYWIGDEYFEFTQEKEDFDYLWLCPNCKRCHVWLNNKNKEFRIYEYKESNNDDINVGEMKEIFLFSANDEENFKENIIIYDLMKLYPHNHRYFISKDEKIVYLYNVTNNKIDGKYILTYRDKI